MATQREAERAVDRHERELSMLPNVVGIGVQPVEGRPTEYQVAVYVSEKVPRSSPRETPFRRYLRRQQVMIRSPSR